MRWCSVLVGLVGTLVWGNARAADIPADPSTYRDLIGTLQPGDVLQLASGEYPRLTISGLHGTPDAWVTIEGPLDGSAVITSDACCNTVQFGDASFVAVRNLTVDAQGLYVNPINAKDAPSHDILIENNTLLGFPPDSQQIVGINTKVTVWNWTIRGNRIIEPGTGIYLGDSDGNDPFIGGVIEYNVVEYATGYCMQIKHQNSYSPLEGMPEGPNRTIIRGNVFLKDDRISPDGDRPNLLVGGFPNDGYGSEDTYEVYGNLLVGNPRESLFQATGTVSIHDNLFVGVGDDQTALLFTEHEGKTIRVAHAYNNTIFGGARGIRLGSPASQSDAVVGNLVFSEEPIGGSITDERDNLVDTVGNAPNYVNAPSVDPAVMDFYPLPGATEGTPQDLSAFASDVAVGRDFNGTDKGEGTFRGAYAGAGENPGCSALALLGDPLGCTTDDGEGETGGSGDSGGVDDSGPETNTSSGDASTGAAGDGDSSGAAQATTSAGSPSEDGAGEGCGCRSHDAPGWAGLFALSLLGLRPRRAVDL